MLLEEQDCPNRWSLAKVTDVYTDRTGDVVVLCFLFTDVNYDNHILRPLLTKINSLTM